jgi:hypothetical protein
VIDPVFSRQETTKSYAPQVGSKEINHRALWRLDGGTKAADGGTNRKGGSNEGPGREKRVGGTNLGIVSLGKITSGGGVGGGLKEAGGN